MLCLMNFIDFSKYTLILNSMPATCFNQAGTGATKEEKVVEYSKNI